MKPILSNFCLRHSFLIGFYISSLNLMVDHLHCTTIALKFQENSYWTQSTFKKPEPKFIYQKRETETYSFAFWSSTLSENVF